MREVVTYQEKQQAYQLAEMRKLTERALQQGFMVADIHLNRSYLESFSNAPIEEAGITDEESRAIRLIHISKLILDKEEKYTEKLISIYSALYSLGSAAALILDSQGEEVDFYMAVKSVRNPALAGDALESTLSGHFPGIEFSYFLGDETRKFRQDLFDRGFKSAASVSVVPSEKNDSANDNINSFTQGLEKFIDTMSGKSYTAVCLAVPLSPEESQMRKQGYEELCSSLTPFAKHSLAYGENESNAVSKSMSTSFSESVSRSVSNSNSRSTSRTDGTSYSSGSSSGGSDSFSFGGGFSSGSSWGSSSSSSSSSSYTSGSSFTNSFTESSGTTSGESLTRGDTATTGSSKTITVTYENKSVGCLIERANQQLERFKRSESFGMWEFAAYFFSEDIHTSVLAGSSYKAIMSGNGSNVERAHLNIWDLRQSRSIQSILRSVVNLCHPQAWLPEFQGGYSKQMVTPTNLVSGNELPYVMGFPKKSVNGLAVVEMAEFGRSVVYENNRPDRSFSIGSVYHMGKKEKARVEMNLDLLASHCFITGSSGSGKSYATYQLLQQLNENNIGMLIIEPAKGEYKQIFGGLKGLRIYTTDPNAYRLLRINPFEFPEEIHVLSHIEQLLQIFNASWQLYAAMPAILKEAVVRAYVSCGWDLMNSIHLDGIGDHRFPVFEDVLRVLPEIINTSDYSADSKGDYKGALLTRVQSMTTGINGLIFQKPEGIESSRLFDSNVVIDLSEMGSEESVALMMGFLTMKLGEYRKAQRKRNPALSLNSKLRHVTVLEEAHNLLKRTSKDQNQEGANMVGKSVEMIGNSIKEMRTYGEGFIIIDQSPMAVDESAIENTATKIIMNTPAKDACEELGSALSLNEEQTSELSRLNVGVAAVFQKGWLSPVLMKVDQWDNRYERPVEVCSRQDLRVIRGQLLEELTAQKESQKFSSIRLRNLIKHNDSLPLDKKKELEELVLAYADRIRFGKDFNRSLFGEFLLEIAGCSQLFEILPLHSVPDFRTFCTWDEEAAEYEENLERLQRASAEWLESFEKAILHYALIHNSEIIGDLVLDMLLAAGHQGDVEKYPDSKICLLCRFIYLRLGESLS